MRDLVTAAMLQGKLDRNGSTPQTGTVFRDLFAIFITLLVAPWISLQLREFSDLPAMLPILGTDVSLVGAVGSQAEKHKRDEVIPERFHACSPLKLTSPMRQVITKNQFDLPFAAPLSRAEEKAFLHFDGTFRPFKIFKCRS